MRDVVTRRPYSTTLTALELLGAVASVYWKVVHFQRRAVLGLLLLATSAGATPSKKAPAALATKAHRPPSSSARRGAPPTPRPVARPAPSAWKSGDATGSLAAAYGELDESSCLRQLSERGVTHTPAATVGAPQGIRLTGALHGVEFRGLEPERSRSASPYEVIDCRLALALDDWAKILSRHEIRTVVHFGVYRPPPRNARVDPKNPHEHALAIDVARFVKNDGTVLDVQKDWHGVLGGTSCGPTATKPWMDSPAARELRALICEATAERLFHVVLTPHYNPQHNNHFHLEVMPNTRWMIVR